MHLIALHDAGHNNPLGIRTLTNVSDTIINVSFFPYFIVKDLLGVLLFLFLLFYFVLYSPNILGHSDNYILANPLSTPPHIVPEWYFLPFYAILRSIPNKAIGVIAMFASILTLYVVPLFNLSFVTSSLFRPFFKKLFWFFVLDCLVLGWIGGNPVEYPFYEVGQISTLFYFIFFYIVSPLFNYLEFHLRGQ